MAQATEGAGLVVAEARVRHIDGKLDAAIDAIRQAVARIHEAARVLPAHYEYRAQLDRLATRIGSDVDDVEWVKAGCP